MLNDPIRQVISRTIKDGDDAFIMSIIKTKSRGINLADNFAFTGNVTLGNLTIV